MDSPPTHSRRRITRTGHVVGDESTATAASSLQAGPSRISEFTQLVDVEFSDLDRSSDDLESDEHATPKLHATNKLPSSEHETPAARLRALLSRVPSGPSPSTTPVAPNPPKSLNDYESENGAADTTHATASHSMAQTSLRSVFSHAMRPAGDTPHKQRRRRNSIDASEVESSPRTERARHKGKRKSLSDEEVENTHRASLQTPSVKPKSQPMTLDVLRQRFMNHSNSDSPEDVPLSKHDLSDDTADLLKELNSSRTSPPAATSTPQQSIRMSFSSQSQMQTNLLEQDSEMQRAFEGVESYDATGVADTGDISRQQVNFLASPEPSVLSPPQTVKAKKALSRADASASQSPRRLKYSAARADGTVKPPAVSSPPDRQPKISNSLSREGSSPRLVQPLSRTRVISSPRPSDLSSRSSSISQADYRERIRDLDEDQASKREREWGSPNRGLPRPTSSQSLNSPNLSERQRTQSLNPSTPGSTSRPYQISPSVAQALRRHSLNFERQDSPTSSAHGSQEDDPVVTEIVQERERNWNSPRPVWSARVRADSISSMSDDGEGEDSHNPPSRTSRMTSPRSLAEIREHVARSRMQSLPDSPSAVRQSPTSLRQSPQTLGRLADQAIASIGSPSRKRHSLHLTSSSGEIARDINASPLLKPSLKNNRLSYHSPSKSVSSMGPGDKSTIRASRKSQIPIVSPSKRKIQQRDARTSTVPLPTSDISPSPSEDDHPPRPNHGLQPPTTTGEETSPLELTPRQRTISPPPIDSPLQQPSPLSQSTNSTVHPEQMGEFNPDISESEINAPFNSTPLDPSNYELPSFTATPPRQATPLSHPTVDAGSVSVDAPELPGPPSTDESDNEPTWRTPPHTRLFPNAGSTTALKTPKPPGAWADTPAPKRRSRAYSDSSMRNAASGSQPPASDMPNWSTIQTPRPPGGWVATPAPARTVQYADQAVETDTEPETDGDGVDSSAAGTHHRGETMKSALSTPAPSISKGSKYALQTPAAPGAWVATPAARKSVRFDSKGVVTDDSTLSDSSELPKPSERHAALQTPPASPELLPTSPSRRKTPSIRVLDAFGNETRDENRMDYSSIKTPRRQPIRFVDALGNVTEEDPSNRSDEADMKVVDGDKNQTLSKMRQGLEGLIQDVHKFDSEGPVSGSELARIKELDAASIQSREKRIKLTQQMHAANVDLKGKIKDFVASSKKPTISHAAVYKPYFRSILLVALVFLQIGVVVVLYRLYSSFTHNAFLTNYYDPYNPLIHLYTSRSRILEANLSEVTPWSSVIDLLRQRDFKLFGDKTLENLYIHLVKCQAYVWEKWGENMTGQSNGWPPT